MDEIYVVGVLALISCCTNDLSPEPDKRQVQENELICPAIGVSRGSRCSHRSEGSRARLAQGQSCKVGHTDRVA